VPLGTIVKVKETVGPGLVQRYDQSVSIPLSGNTAPGYSSSQAIASMEKLAHEVLPPGVDFEWTATGPATY